VLIIHAKADPETTNEAITRVAGELAVSEETLKGLGTGYASTGILAKPPRPSQSIGKCATIGCGLSWLKRSKATTS